MANWNLVEMWKKAPFLYSGILKVTGSQNQTAPGVQGKSFSSIIQMPVFGHFLLFLCHIGPQTVI